MRSYLVFVCTFNPAISITSKAMLIYDDYAAPFCNDPNTK